MYALTYSIILVTLVSLRTLYNYIFISAGAELVCVDNGITSRFILEHTKSMSWLSLSHDKIGQFSYLKEMVEYHTWAQFIL